MYLRLTAVTVPRQSPTGKFRLESLAPWTRPGVFAAFAERLLISSFAAHEPRRQSDPFFARVLVADKHLTSTFTRFVSRE